MSQAFRFEQDIPELGALNPGKLTLPDVPIHEELIELGTPYRRPVFTLDIAVESGLIDIRRSDGKAFNVAHYRSQKDGTGPLQPHLMLGSSVSAVLLWRYSSGLWRMDGLNLEVTDLMAARCFVEKVAEIAEKEQAK